MPIPLKVTLVFTNRIGRSNLSRGWASWWPRVHTRKLLGLQFACVSIKMQVAAVFLSRGKVSPRAGRPKSRWGNCRACTSRRGVLQPAAQSTICCLSGFHDHMLSVHFGYLLSSWITPPPPLPPLPPPPILLTRKFLFQLIFWLFR